MESRMHNLKPWDWTKMWTRRARQSANLFGSRLCCCRGFVLAFPTSFTSNPSSSSLLLHYKTTCWGPTTTRMLFSTRISAISSRMLSFQNIPEDLVDFVLLAKLAVDLRSTGTEPITPEELANCLCGLQNLTGDSPEVCSVLKVSLYSYSIQYLVLNRLLLTPSLWPRFGISHRLFFTNWITALRKSFQAIVSPPVCLAYKEFRRTRKNWKKSSAS